MSRLRQTLTDLAKGIALLALVIVPAAYLYSVAGQSDEIALGAARQITPTLVEPGRPQGRVAAPLPLAVPFLSFRLSTLSAADTAPQTDLERDLVVRLNADRQQYGLTPLEFDPPVLPISRTRATDQLGRASLSHLDAVGRIAFGTLLAESELSFRLAGENLARLPDGPTAAQQAQVALMNSPTHRKNILEPRFNRVAIGAAYDGQGRVALAQLFRAVD